MESGDKRFSALLLVALLVLVLPVSGFAQSVDRLGKKAGFKNLKLGMGIEQAILSVPNGIRKVITQNEIYRFEKSDLNSIGTYNVKSTTLQFKDAKLAEIKLHIEEQDNINGILEALKLAYGEPSLVPLERTDSLAIEGDKMFVWLPSPQMNAAGEITVKVNAVLCTVDNYHWESGNVNLDYSIFSAIHYPLTFATMTIYDRKLMGRVQTTKNVMVKFQQAAEDL
jgi:hypothetical protein